MHDTFLIYPSYFPPKKGKMHKKFLPFIFLIACLLYSACKNSEIKSNYPEVLRFGVSTLEEDPEQARYRMKGMKAYLEKELGIEVEIHEVSGYATIIEALKSKKLDICSLGSFSYILAAQSANVEAISCRGTLNGRPEPYHGVLITSPSSGLKSIDDVKKNASGLTLAFGDPASTSGHLIPRAYLETIGLTNNKFKQTFFTNSHSTTFFTVRSGKTDIGCVSESTINKLIKEGRVKRNEFVVLWKSDPIINSAIGIRKDLDIGFKLEVQKALADFRFKDPANWKKYGVLIAKQTILPYDSLCLINAHDSMFNELRQLSGRYNLLRQKR